VSVTARPHLLQKDTLWPWLKVKEASFVHRFIMSRCRSSLRCSGMARDNKGSHSFTSHLHVYPRTFTLQLQRITTVWLVLISHTTEGRRLSWRGWFDEILRWFARPKTVIHPSTSHGGWESNSQPSSRKSSTLTTRLLSHPTVG